MSKKYVIIQTESEPRVSAPVWDIEKYNFPEDAEVYENKQEFKDRLEELRD